MELHEGVIIIAVVAVCSVIVHKVYRFAMRGKTYEEAIAEQRKMPLEHLLLGRGGKDKNKEKKPKKVGKKVKEKPVEKEKVDQPAKVNAAPKAEGNQKNPINTINKAEGAPKAPNNAALVKTTVPSSNPAVHSEKHRAVEFGKPETEFVNEQALPQQDENKSKKKKKVEKGLKPILLNRDEVSPVDVSAVKDEPVTPCKVNHFEESKPKDEFLKRKQSIHVDRLSLSSNKKEEAANPTAKPKEKVKAPVVDKAQPESSDTKTKIPPMAEKEQAKQIEKVSSGSTPLAPQAPAQPSSPVVLEKESRAAEVVASTEVSSHAVSSTVTLVQETKRKKKKSDLATLQQMAGPGGVNVSLLEPLIRKAELSRSEVQNLIDLLLNKQQESAVENAEWTEGRQDPMVKLKKQLAEREKALAEEQEASQGWQARVRELRAELNGERSRLGANVRKLESSIESLMAKLQNESESHANEKRVLSAQLQELQSKLAEERLQIHKLQEQEGTTVATLQQELHSQRQQMEVHIARLNEKRQEEETGLKSELTRLQEEVEQREKSRVLLTTELCQVREELAALQASSAGSEEDRNRLRELANNAEAAANTASDMVRRIEEDARNSRIELEQHVAELKAVTSGLKMREAELQAELSRVIEEANAEKSRIQLAAREAEERARNAEETLARVEAEKLAGGQVEAELQSKHQRLIQEKESFIQQLSEELKYYKTEIPKLSEALETQRKKNDELRHKNWKAMDALTTTENTLKAHLKTSQNVVIEESQKAILGEQEAVKQLLQRLLPNVIVDDAKSHSEWLTRFEASACDYLKQSNQAQVEIVCDGHEKEIQHLQARVSHYQTIVKDTEAILSKLQSSVEEQEADWAEQLRKKEEELKQVAGERNDLVATLEELKGLDKLNVSSETQEKCKEMQSKLEVEEENKNKLVTECDHLQRINCSLDTKLSAAQKKVEQLQEDVNSLSHELSTRKEQNDDLSKEVVRLNSLIKIGQASLSQEQLQVKEMEEELEKLKVQSQNHTATNGPASESSLSESLSKEVKSPSNPVSSSELPNMEKRGKSKKKKTTKQDSVKRRRFSGWFSKKLTNRKKLKNSQNSLSSRKD